MSTSSIDREYICINYTRWIIGIREIIVRLYIFEKYESLKN